ncbi:gastric triacylglycerol lipase-like [Leptinotarsa decemlineata]|uniref:gastric triacylglycerol lipase-like n=1 Tax=Leptinotarsa decemlineata TaxID=7539 RepID=UPI003D3073D6
MCDFSLSNKELPLLPYILLPYYIKQAKFLGDHGYDIWMINFRGTSESLGHVNKSADNLDYWTFSFHELGYYDIPAVLDLIIRTTNQKPIYLGISLGSTASYVFGSARPDMAKEKLKGIISYAPVGYMKNIKSYVKFLAPFQPILEVCAVIKLYHVLYAILSQTICFNR